MNQTIIPAEMEFRRRLGIPADARQVIIFSESSHWDPNWLFTAGEYFDRFVRNNLDQALEALQREPRRIYSVECMFFLRMYWDRYPEKQAVIREYVNNGRLRLTSSGVTTADTIVPSAEAILRDLLIGQEWLRSNGMQQEPKLAYFTDSFGCTPTLPSLLNAAGFDRTAITRVDGMYFMGCDLESAKNFPRPGSTAERLLKQERSLDFIWRDQNGAELLTHWNAYTYGQGDMLAFTGLSRVYLVRVAFSNRSDSHIARRIQEYTAQLSPYSRTPYLYCPIGFDFVEPIPELTSLLDRYNQTHYPKTGVWVVNAGLDDYLSLIEFYKDTLPVLQLDPNPYWTGFYTARPTLKQRGSKLVSNLLLAEKLSFHPQNQPAEETIAARLEESWWRAAVSNHHDFITGTSPDRVAEEEQIPWLDQAMQSVTPVLEHLGQGLSSPSIQPQGGEPIHWERADHTILIETTHYRMQLDENAGGIVIQQLFSRDSQTPLLQAASNELVGYQESGGLWRMGYEFAGGKWKESARDRRNPVPIKVIEREGGLELSSKVELDGESFTHRLFINNTSPLIFGRVVGKAAQGHTVTVRLNTGIHTNNFWMDTPGGMVQRPPERIYHPTYWPLHRFVHIQAEDGRGLAVFQAFPGAISYQPDGRLDLVAARNATKEKAFGFISIPGNPASGHERESYTFDYALLFTEKGNWQENNLAAHLRTFYTSPWSEEKDRSLQIAAESILTTNIPDVWVAAIKPASHGEGIIVRLNALTTPKVPVLLSAPELQVTQAFLCDARERDIHPLTVQNNATEVRMTGTVATVRLISSESHD